MPATIASTHTGARKMSASTIGIRTAAVAIRLSKGCGTFDAKPQL